eukprot:TRINITY_DN11455_c0_g2_i4.p1 TRINITY_DN11455_c0_g2~~TRINITY_DN11455_c0_g2_i4.p1  ORF type:complete len:214 (+),score=27.99 TRINITY_DN11455_c0_g2_i4:73-714(+)
MCIRDRDNPKIRCNPVPKETIIAKKNMPTTKEELEIELRAPPLELVSIYSADHVFLAAYLLKPVPGKSPIRLYCEVAREEFRCCASKEALVSVMAVGYSEIDLVRVKNGLKGERNCFEILPKSTFWTKSKRRYVLNKQEDSASNRKAHIGNIIFENAEEAQDYLQYRKRTERREVNALIKKKQKGLTFSASSERECEEWVSLLNWMLNVAITS